MTVVPPSNPQIVRGIDRVLSVQRPVVLAHIRTIRRAHPDATPAEVIRILERRYVLAVTSGGALVGASAALPAIGTATALALSATETAGFLEASALFAQSITEVHGIVVEDPERARTLVMSMMLGSAGADLVRQLAGQATGKGPSRNGFWGEMVTKSLPAAAVGQMADSIKKSFLKRFVATQGTTIVGRAIPFGIGAVVGGSGNNILGRKVVSSSRDAFGPAPASFPLELELRLREPKPPRAPRSPKEPREKRVPGARRLRAIGGTPKSSRTKRGTDGWIETDDDTTVTDGQ